MEEHIVKCNAKSVERTTKKTNNPTRIKKKQADGDVEGDFSKNRKKETTTKDCTEVKADKETTSDIHEEKRSES